MTERFDGLAGGLERWAVQFVTHLHQRGHEVHVVTFGEGNHGLPVTLHVLPSHSSVMVRAQRIASCIAGLGSDVVHDTGSGWSGDAFHPQTGSHLLSLDREIASHARWRRIKAGISPRTNLRRWRLARLEAAQARSASHIIAASARIRQHFIEQHGVPQTRISVIPNGVDTARFAPDRIRPLRADARKALAVADDVLLLGFAYNLRLKGMDNAIRALASLRGEGVNVRLAIAGGAADPFWIGLAANPGIADRVSFLGPVDDVAPLLAAADVLVHPTRWDACSAATI